MAETGKRFLMWLASTNFGTWLAKHIFSRLDPIIFRLSKGRFTAAGPVNITYLVLTTTGRKYGRERSVQLVYTDIDGVSHIVASNFGQQHHPAWSYNLAANPQATVARFITRLADKDPLPSACEQFQLC